MHRSQVFRLSSRLVCEAFSSVTASVSPEHACGTFRTLTWVTLLLLFTFRSSLAQRHANRNARATLDPRSALGLSDGGAHCGLICDASYPTFLLTHWARDRHRGPKFDLEYVVRKQTLDTATLFGLSDRGVIQVGKKADINVIDIDALTLELPKMVYDLPAGGRRLIQGAKGYDATVVSGAVTRRDSVDTGARPGRLIRGVR